MIEANARVEAGPNLQECSGKKPRSGLLSAEMQRTESTAVCLLLVRSRLPRSCKRNGMDRSCSGPMLQLFIEWLPSVDLEQQAL